MVGYSLLFYYDSIPLKYSDIASVLISVTVAGREDAQILYPEYPAQPKSAAQTKMPAARAA